MAAPGPRKRPIKIRNSQDTLRIGIVVGSLAELKEEGPLSLALNRPTAVFNFKTGLKCLTKNTSAILERAIFLL